MRTSPWNRSAAGSVLVAALCACGAGAGGGPGPGDVGPLGSAFQGTWSACLGGATLRHTLAISGTRFTYTETEFPSSPCQGTPSTVWTDTGTITQGEAFPTTLGATPVTAVECDKAYDGYSTVHDICFVDVAADPDALYLGLETLARSGSSAATRRQPLDDGYVLLRE